MAARPLAVLTGASSGIGAALAPLLVRDGYDLLLVARREALLADTAKRAAAAAAGARADTLALDLGAPGAAERLVERAPDAALVVNNAGFGKVGPALEIDLDTYRRMIALNVAALTEITWVFARRMAERGAGTILNVASTAAFQPIPYQAVYAATKAYVVSMSEALHFELRARGVSVLAFCPGPTETEFVSVAGAQHLEARGKLFFETAEACAECAAKAIRRREETRVSGLLNRLGVFLARKGPRRLVRWTVAMIMRPSPGAARKP